MRNSQTIKKQHNDKGFNLLELAMAIGVFSILLLAGTLSYNQIINGAKQSSVNQAAEQVYTKASSYQTSSIKDKSPEDAETEFNNSTKKDKNGSPIIMADVEILENTSLKVTASMENGKYTAVREASSESNGSSGNGNNPGDGSTIPTIEDVISTMTYTCDQDRTGRLGFSDINPGTEVYLYGNDGTETKINLVQAPNSSLLETPVVTLKAGITYNAKIIGTFNKISHGTYVENSSLRHCVTSLDKIAEDSGIQQLELIGGEKLTTVPNQIPESITSLDSAFYSTNIFNQNISNWKTDNVKSLRYAFRDATSFNQDISSWNVSNVESLEGAFYGATSYNMPLNNWNTNSLTRTHAAFYDAKAFNQPIDNWDMDKVTHAGYMFRGADSFNQNLDNWNVDRLTDISGMFYQATSFNGSINGWGDSTGNLTNMRYLFYQAFDYNQPMNNWNTSRVTDMSHVFRESGFNQSVNDWDTSNVILMNHIFYRAANFDQPLNNWDTSSATNMNYIFRESNFNQDVSMWNVENVTTNTLYAYKAPIENNSQYLPKFTI